MNRRSFIQVVTAAPVAGVLALKGGETRPPKPRSEPQTAYLYTFFDADGNVLYGVKPNGEIVDEQRLRRLARHSGHSS